MPQSRTTWFCVADAGGARILEAPAPRAALTEIAKFAHETYEHGRYEAPGKTHESATTARHSFVDAEGPIRREKRAFAHVVADYLAEAAERRAYGRLVIAAPPKFLGDLRAALSPAAKARIVGEIHKDLTKENEAALAVRLAEMANT